MTISNTSTSLEKESGAQQSLTEKDTLSTFSSTPDLLEQDVPGTVDDDAPKLKRHLEARHISMISIGGALGTGLVIGSGASLAAAGPAAMCIAYLLVGIIVYFVMCALGEMATWLPLTDGFPGYASRFCDPALGFAIGWMYYVKYIVVAPNQLTAAAMVLQYWVPREVVNPGVWVALILAAIVLVNMFGVRFFGEMEFWLSCVKVLTMLGLILLTLVIALGGGPDHDRRGFRYYSDPGAFKPFEKGGRVMEGSLGKFVAWASVLVTAVFAFMGTELVGIMVGEAANPRRNIPRAIKLTFYRIVVFYLVSIFLLGLCVPYNDSGLVFASKAGTSAAASPFVVAISNAGIAKLNHVINACLFIFIVSGSNSDMYIATRALYGLASQGLTPCPRLLMHTNRWGIPYVSLLITGAFGLLSLFSISASSATVFGYFVSVVSVMGLLAWGCILVLHISFVRGMEAQHIDAAQLVYRAPWRPYGSYVALAFCCLIALFKNFAAFIYDVDVAQAVLGYIGLPIFFALAIGYKLVKKTRWIKPEEIDFFPPIRHQIDAEEREYVAQQEKLRRENPPTTWQKMYENSVGYLF